MEVLLLHPVANIGNKSDIVVVGDGYALNYLLPRKLGIVATPLVRKRFAEQIKIRLAEREKERTARHGVIAALAGKQLVFSKKASKTGKLYAGLTEKHIAEALKEQLAIDVSENAVEMADHIKAVGTHAVTVRMGDAAQSLAVVVKADTSAK